MVKLKKWLSLLILVSVSFSLFAYNYGEVLQKAIFFYEAQQAGPLPDWNRVEWRADATMDDYVQGGWYDAGDHVKFGLPMAYSASMLGWAAYEYEDAFKASGQWDELTNNLRFVLDYFVNAHQGNQLVYQIGDGNADHSWWGPVEVIHLESRAGDRPYYTTSASCVTAQTAAALAIGSIVLDDDEYLTHAQSLYSLADSTRSDNGYTQADGFYDSWSGFWDELMWAATWLYIATNDNAYLSAAESIVPRLNKQGQDSDLIEYQWGHCWDDVHYGTMILLARLTGKAVYADYAEMHLDWWTTGFQGNRIAYTPGGLAWLGEWGALRHATTTAFLAFVYGEWVEDSALSNRYLSFAESQIDYALGDNEQNRSYVVGFGHNPPCHPHHRTAHSSWTDQMDFPSEHRHTLYGALVGGPNRSGNYTDVITNYQTNEVATDYNAAFVGTLARMYRDYGGNPLTNFPPPETKDDEFFVEAGLNSSGPTYTEIKALVNNRSGWPARVISDLSFSYFFDLSEVFAAGYDTSDISVTTNYVEFPVIISPITRYSGDIYYLNIAFEDGTNIYPGGQSEYAAEVQFRLAAPSGTTFWDPANDHSVKGLELQEITKTSYITMYDGSRLIWGQEPSGATVPPATPTPEVTPSPTPVQSCVLPGDGNGDGKVTIIDALMTAQYSVRLDPPGFNPNCCDLTCDGTVSIIDALNIAQISVGMITFTPCF